MKSPASTRCIRAVRDLDKPCIVAFNGVAAGAGFQIALCADLRIGYPEMKLGQPEIKAGLASIVGSYLMTMHLGLSKNVELSLTGELISGQVAYEIGILNHLVPRAEVMNKSLALAADMSKLGSLRCGSTSSASARSPRRSWRQPPGSQNRPQKEAYASGEPQGSDPQVPRSQEYKKILSHRRTPRRSPEENRERRPNSIMFDTSVPESKLAA